MILIKKIFSLLLIIAIISLGYNGYFDPITKFLQSKELSFTFGDLEFSLYTIIRSIFIIIILFFLASVVSSFSEDRIRRLKKMNFSNRQLLIKTAQIIIYIITFMMTLRVIGIDIKALAIFSGAIGIGVGFGLQKISSNFISGIILLFEKTLNKNDLIEIDAEVRGFIKKIKARYTLIETLDNKEIMIPNEDLITQKVTNCTYSNKTGRVFVDVGVSYDSDVHQVHDLMIEAAQESDKCLRDPSPKCCLTEFGDSSVNFRLYFWMENVSSGVVYAKSEIMFAIWDKLKEHNIQIPFPQRDIHIKSNSSFPYPSKDS